MAGLSLGTGFLLLKITALLKTVINASTLSGALCVSIITSLVFVLVFSGAGYLFKIQEINRFNHKLIQKLGRLFFS